MENELIETLNQNVSVMRDPHQVLKEAKEAAQALMSVVSQKKKPVIMNGEQYLEFEDWQTLARFYGLTVKVVRTDLVDYGGVKGFEASAEVIRSDGAVLSAANAMCLNDEEKWSTRTKYEYVNNVRTKVGEVPVPLFQLRSMAQTRACAKALRNVLAWVAVLAGFKPTPAEEMDGVVTQPTTKPEVTPPVAKSDKPANGQHVISEKQGKRLIAIAIGKGYTVPIVTEYVKANYSFDRLSAITVDKYDEIVKHYEDAE